MDKIEVVIPHRGRDHLLLETLKSLEHQSFADFGVTVVVDLPLGDEFSAVTSLIPTSLNLPIDIISGGGNGPATARNRGAEHANADIVLFIGSDCIAHKDLVGWHYLNHSYGADIVQGYTDWHPDVKSPLTDIVDETGLQASWSNLQDNGVWKREISPAFCLTTNYSINKQLFMNNRFDEDFSGAAWEDVELGHTLAKQSDAIRALFVPEAFNMHYHRYTFDSFLDRCEMEGYHRLTICKKHPEMAWNMTNPFELRTAKDINAGEIRRWAHELDSVDLRDTEKEAVRQLKNIKYQRYYEACKVFSLKGVLRRIHDEHPAMQALLHMHRNESVIQIISGVNALDNGQLGYAAHTAQWLTTERSDDWAAWSYLGEIELEMGNKTEALTAFRRAASINPSEKWPKKRLMEIINE